MLSLVHDCQALLAQVLAEVAQTAPQRGVHVNMVLVGDVFLVDLVCFYPLCAMSVMQYFQESLLEVSGKGINHVFTVLCEELHVVQVALARSVTLKALRIATLL